MRSPRAISRPSLAALGVALALQGGSAAMAQGSQGALTLEEITVTARRVEENLMTVPLAVTAFSDKDIEDSGIKQLTDIMRMTPNLNFVNQSGGSGRNERGQSSLVFRGLFLSNAGALNTGGQLFVDGAPVFGGQPPPIVDVQRVEVLKGPQSAYFGRSTFAGAVNFIMKEPGEEFGGTVSLEGSSDSSHDASLSFEGPLFSDKLAARITARDFKRGGYIPNTGAMGGDLGEQTTQSLSGSIVWRPTESLKVKFHGAMFEDDDGPPAQGAVKLGEFTGRVDGRTATQGACVPFSQAPAGTAGLGQTANSRASFGFYCGELPGADALAAANALMFSGDYDFTPTATYNALYNPNPSWIIFGTGHKKDGGLRREASQADLRIDWEFGGGYNLSSLSATHFDKTMVVLDLNYRDAHNIANPFYNNPMNPACNAATCVPWLQGGRITQNRLKDWSQELRLTSPTESRFRWTFGANYIEQFTPGGTVYGISATGPSFSASITAAETKTPAVFGGAYFDITDTITLGAEGRYQEDDLSQQVKIAVNGLPPTGLGALPLEATFTSFSPRISIDWKYAENSTVYALYSKGTRPGGFNSALVTTPQAALDLLLAVVPNAGISYEEEELENIELGLKSTWLDGRARTQLTVFFDEWKNGQVANSIPVTIPGTGVQNLIGLTVNNGTADIWGAEFEGQMQVTENLRLMATVGYNDTEVKTFGLSPTGLPNCSDCNFIYGSFDGVLGNRLPTVPELTWSLSADYSHRLTDTLDWYGRLDFSSQGEKYTDFANYTKIGESQVGNLRLGIRNERLTIEGFVTNFTDEDTLLSAQLGVDLFSFALAAAGVAQRNEVRLSPPIPRQYGLRVSYDF